MPVIGVSIAVPEPWATELYDYRQQIGDPTALGVPSHITLIPPVEYDGDLALVEQHLADAGAGFGSFPIHLRGTGTFRPVSPVVFVALAEGIARCEQLANACRSGLLDVDLSYPYHPHVTIAHHVDDEALDRAFSDFGDFECRFDVIDFHLYVHDPVDGWRPTRTFSL